MSWHPGDIAEVIPHDGRIPGGAVVKLIEYLGDTPNIVNYKFVLVKDAWSVDWNGARFDISEPLLQRQGGYDGVEVTTWDECVWQPGVTA